MVPLIKTVEAQRASVNCPRGAQITKPVSVADKGQISRNHGSQSCPSNKEKWLCRNQNIIIQIDKNNAAFVDVATAGLWNIKLETQKPTSLP